MRFIRKEFFVILLFLTASILLFSNINHSLLWEDEAETAVIAKNILTSGSPSVFDGRNIVTQEWGQDSNSNNIWIHQSWLPHYITAFSFKLFGVNTFTARISFIIFGFLTIFVFYHLIKIETQNKELALFSSALITCSVTFLLHVKQCRYYSVLILLSILFIFALWKHTAGPKNTKNILLPILLGTLLFHTQYIAALTTFAASAITLLIYSKKRARAFLHLTIIISSVLTLALPWIIYVKLWNKFGEVSIGLLDHLSRWTVNVLFNTINLNHFILPLPLLIISCYYFYKKKYSSFENYFFLTGLFILAISSFSPLFPDIRYILILIPWAAFFMGKIVLNIFKQNKYFAGFLFLLIITTNLLSLPFWYLVKPLFNKEIKSYYRDLRFDLKDYFFEISNSYTGPVRASTAFLRKNSSVSDTLFVTYGAEPYIFYTGLKIVRNLPFTAPPDWIILREKRWPKWLKWVLMSDNLTDQQPQKNKPYIWNYHSSKETAPVWNARKKYILNYLEQNNYQRIKLNAPDLMWENRPSLLYHRFGNEPAPQEALHIFRKIK